MSELLDILKECGRLNGQAAPYALATVVSVSGSTYRGVGARMLISAAGDTCGSISGGCLEGDVFEKARRVREEGKPRLLTYDTTAPEDIFWGTGMGCGGVTEVFLMPSTAAHGGSLLPQAAEHLRRGQTVGYALIFQVEPQAATPAGAELLWDGQQIIAHNFPAAAPLEALCRDLQEVTAAGGTEVRRYHWPQGEVSLLLETLSPPVPLVIFGGGYDVYPVIALAKQLRWTVTVVEHREPFATQERFPQADAVLFWGEEPNPPEELHLAPHTVCLLMTHHYLTDKKILPALLASPCPYVGILGPQQRARQLLDELRSEGVGISREALKRLYSPVGLDVGAETAEEIALSVVGEILAVLKGREGGSLRRRKGPIHER